MADSDRAGSSLRVHEWMQSNPFVSSNRLVEQIGLSPPTINAALADLEHLGIISEGTGKRRNRVFSYTAFLDILSEGTNPI
jgi:Fic family protein